MNPSEKSLGTSSQLLHSAELSIQGQDFHPILKQLKNFHQETAQDSIRDSTIRENLYRLIEELFQLLENFLEALTVIRELSTHSSDRILRVGEKLSALILSHVLEDRNIASEYVDLSNIAPSHHKRSDSIFYKELENILKERIEKTIENQKIPILTGFIGEIPEGILNAVGRGYSDFTASLVSVAIQAKELQIWKEVDGIFTADPKIVPQAELIDTLTPKEASELTYFGSEVIHPFTMERVIQAKIPVRIKNTFNPRGKGTVIQETPSKKTKTSPIKSITCKKNIFLLNIESNRMLMSYGFMAKVFRAFEEYEMVIDLIATSEVNISLTLEKGKQMERILEKLGKLGNVSLLEKRAIVILVGENMRKVSGIAGKMFQTLAQEGISIEVISQGASEINISCVIPSQYADQAIQALHRSFISSE